MQRRRVWCSYSATSALRCRSPAAQTRGHSDVVMHDSSTRRCGALPSCGRRTGHHAGCPSLTGRRPGEAAVPKHQPCMQSGRALWSLTGARVLCYSCHVLMRPHPAAGAQRHPRRGCSSTRPNCQCCQSLTHPPPSQKNCSTQAKLMQSSPIHRRRSSAQAISPANALDLPHKSLAPWCSPHSPSLPGRVRGAGRTPAPTRAPRPPAPPTHPPAWPVWQ